MKLKREKLKRARDRLGWSMKEVAASAGVDETTVLNAEHGKGIRPITARKLAAGLGVEVVDLLPPEEGDTPEHTANGNA
jgi:transcriptional regulator with XRE-family HTH domain